MQKYESEWKGAYSNAFSQLDNGGKVSVDELRDLMKSEFGGYGVRFVDRAPSDPKAGQNLVHIDEANLQKMANDPEYRAQAFAVIQAELVSTKGYSFKEGSGTVSSSLTGTVISISDDNPKSRGDVPYSGMAMASSAQSGPGQSGSPQSGSAAKKAKGKSMMDIIKEMREKWLEEKKAQEKREAVQAGRQESIEALRTTDDTGTAGAEPGQAVTDGKQTPPSSPLPGGTMDLIG